MASGRKYPQELKDRAIRLVGEAREQEEGLSQHAAVVRIARLVGVHADTLRVWVRQTDINAGRKRFQWCAPDLEGIDDHVPVLPDRRWGDSSDSFDGVSGQQEIEISAFRGAAGAAGAIECGYNVYCPHRPHHVFVVEDSTTLEGVLSTSGRRRICLV